VPASTSLMLGWLALLAASAALFVLVAVAAWWQHRREVPSRARQRAERAAWAQHAAALAERAQQAAARAATVRAAVAEAEQARAAAWAELEQIEAAHDAAARRHAEAVRRTSARGGNERPAGQAVTHAALGAYRRGDLTKEQLWRVWQWGTGWDPEVDRCERELYRLRADRRAAHQRYQAAASHERDVLAAADVAEVQARALAEEVATASAEAGWDDGLRAQLS
jgi:hypothetical protein